MSDNIQPSETTTMTQTQTPAEPEATTPPTPETPSAQAQAPETRTPAKRRAKPAPSPTPAAPRADRAASRRATSDVGALRSFALAIPFYGLAILCAKMAPAGARSILLDRGWPPHATMILTCLAVAILLTKAFGLRRQRRAFALDLLPEGNPRIEPAAAAKIVEHAEEIRGLRGERSFLVERVIRVLTQYAAHGDVAEATAANDADADADAASVAASFSTVKVLVWAMPILGLIGTVVGLSGAVGAFSHAMSGAEQLDTIKESLRDVTTGLAVAFDATFVALVASILVMLPLTWLQKAEDKLINDVDDYCVTHVLAHLGGSAQPAAQAEQASAARPAEPLDAGEIRQILAGALAQPLADLLSANARLMDRMSQDRAALAGAQDALVAQLSAFAATMQEAVPALERAAGRIERAATEAGPSIERVAAEIGRATAQVGPSVDRVVAALDKSAAAVGPSIDRAVGQLDRTTAQATQGMERAVAALERTAGQVEERVAPSVERAAGQIERAVTQLEVTTAVAEQAAVGAERAQDQLSRELGASRQLLSLLASGLGAGEAPAARPRHANGTHGANGTNGTNGANGTTSAARGG